MRIAEVASVATAVKREGSGSIEQVVWTLSQGLLDRGHSVTVFGVAGSESPGDLVCTLPGPYGHPDVPEEWRVAEWVNVARALERADDFDVVHSHGYLYGLPLAPLCSVPMVHTLHVMPPQESAALARLYPSATITALSAHQWSEYPDLQQPRVIPNGIPSEAFTFTAEPDGYLAFLGRFAPGKGVVTAIETARRLGLPIHLAGWANDMYAAEVAPLVDGEAVRFVGPVYGRERDRFLGGAVALLYPITSHEPFGMVMPEAMLCGTPVAAFRVGAVPEIVEEDVTGFTVPVGADLAPAVRSALTLDRTLVARVAADRFSSTAMVLAYETLFEDVIRQSGDDQGKGTGRLL
jgi:glycosyltransferase involved in cell wall biosynthesis